MTDETVIRTSKPLVDDLRDCLRELHERGCEFGEVIDPSDLLCSTQWHKALDEAERVLERLPDETTERRLAEACERLRRCAALVAMSGDQSMALAINRHSERLLGDISAWSERETSEKANACQCDPNPSTGGSPPCPVHDGESEDAS